MIYYVILSVLSILHLLGIIKDAKSSKGGYEENGIVRAKDGSIDEKKFLIIGFVSLGLTWLMALVSNKFNLTYGKWFAIIPVTAGLILHFWAVNHNNKVMGRK